MKKGCQDLHDPTPCGTKLELSEFVWDWKGKKYRWRTCPANLVDPSMALWLSLYAAWQDGFLLTDGGLMKQPAAYIQAMFFIKSEIHRIYEEKQKRKTGQGAYLSDRQLRRMI